MPYTSAQTAAMNRQGAALLRSQAAGTYRPPTSTSASTYANSVSNQGTTLGRSGSRAGDPVYTGKVSDTYDLSTLGNQKINSYGGSTISSGGGGTAPPPPIPDYGGGDTFDWEGYINQLKQAQIDANVNALNSKLNSSLSNLDSQQAAIQPYYYDKRNQAAARSDISALNFAQRAAARGISGNAGSMPEIYRNASLMGQIGALDQSEAAAQAGIERDRTLIRNNYESDLAAAKAGAEATALDNYLSQMNTNREFDLRESDVTGTYKGTQTMQGRNQSIQNAMAQLELEAAQLQNSYLPETLKLEVEKLRQDVASGKIDVSKAQAQLARIKSGTSSSGLSFNQALDAWNSGIDTPAIRSVLGIQ